MYQKEKDLLTKDSEGECIKEEYANSLNTDYAFVTNSTPFYARQTHHDGRVLYPHGGGRYSTTGFCNLDRQTQDSLCPKVAWGYTAYLLCNTTMGTRLPLLAKGLTFDALGGRYLAMCMNRHDAECAEDIAYYHSLNDTDALDKIEQEFLAQHYAEERELFERTKAVSVDFKGKESLLSVVERYLQSGEARHSVSKEIVIAEFVIPAHIVEYIKRQEPKPALGRCIMRALQKECKMPYAPAEFCRFLNSLDAKWGKDGMYKTDRDSNADIKQIKRICEDLFHSNVT